MSFDRQGEGQDRRRRRQLICGADRIGSRRAGHVATADRASSTAHDASGRSGAGKRHGSAKRSRWYSMLRVASGVVLAALWICPSIASADSQTFTPVADAYVSSADPGANYGSATRLEVEGSPTVRSYLRFDVELPQGAQITGATLRLYTGA